MQNQMTIQQALDRALVSHQSGRLEEAEALYRQILAYDPNQSDALHLLGLLANQAGQKEIAVELIRRAITVNPRIPEYHGNLGQVLRAAGKIDDAIAAYQKAIAVIPAFEAFRFELGNILYQKGSIQAAVEQYRQAIFLKPDYFEAHANLGRALFDARQFPESAEAYRKALALRPNSFEACTGLGHALREQTKFDEAIESFRRACEINPQFPPAWSNLGNILADAGQLSEAEKCYWDAIKLHPQFPLLHSNLAVLLLSQGRLREGWKEFAWRRQVKHVPVSRREHPLPPWDGGALNGRKILIHAEQGLGDAIQFARYIPLIDRRGGRIALECQPQLFRLFASLPGIAQMITDVDPVPQCDVQFPLMDLPMIFETTLETIPSEPYLVADVRLVQRWRERMSTDSNFKTGLAWAGKPTHRDDRDRSIALSALFPLAELPGIAFYSLQKGPASNQPAGPLKLIDWTSELSDFADTAALIANLDLVICVDTAVAHLAGAMGRPVWVLLPFASDWRWMRDRPDSPWYPSMRLFRQVKFGDWTEPLLQVLESLAELARVSSKF